MTYDMGVYMYDKWSKIEEAEASLDGESITLPYHTSSSDLLPGKHSLKVTATDLAGPFIIHIRLQDKVSFIRLPLGDIRLNVRS